MRYIKLTRGKRAIVDNNDFDKVSRYKWSYISGGYAIRAKKIPGTRRSIYYYMHREIVGAGGRECVDHLNHNTLDNRKKNLLICSHRTNMTNQKLSTMNTSGFKGVTWDAGVKKWRAQVKYFGKCIYLGVFNNKKDAVRSRKLAEEKYEYTTIPS